MSTDAVNAPVRHAPKETHTSDFKLAQKASIENLDEYEGDVLVAPEQLQKDYQSALAFNEQPVTIRIEPSSEKFAPRAIDVTCNGTGAEVWMNGRWVQARVLPVGMPVTTKRKYVEILARSKTDTINTRHDTADAEHPRNFIDRYTSSRAPFSVLEDKDPRGAAWLSGLVTFG